MKSDDISYFARNDPEVPQLDHRRGVKTRVFVTLNMISLCRQDSSESSRRLVYKNSRELTRRAPQPAGRPASLKSRGRRIVTLHSQPLALGSGNCNLGAISCAARGERPFVMTAFGWKRCPEVEHEGCFLTTITVGLSSGGSNYVFSSIYNYVSYGGWKKMSSGALSPIERHPSGGFYNERPSSSFFHFDT